MKEELENLAVFFEKEAKTYSNQSVEYLKALGLPQEGHTPNTTPTPVTGMAYSAGAYRIAAKQIRDLIKKLK